MPKLLQQKPKPQYIDFSDMEKSEMTKPMNEQMTETITKPVTKPVTKSVTKLNHIIKFGTKI